MNAFFSKYKTPVILGLTILAAVGGWWVLAPEPAPESLLTTESVVGETPIDRGLIDTLLTLRAVSLSGTIFADPAFAILSDFGTQIVPEPVGRPNPFAPLTRRATSTPRTTQLFQPRR